jgi:hypothetical protein
MASLQFIIDICTSTGGIFRLLEAALKVAITLPFEDDYFVKAEDFVAAIKTTLQTEEGTAMRERAKKYKLQIAADLAPGGSSSNGIIEFADTIKSGLLQA